ncbi:hypothetical protein Sjap_012289 [Stephania japonica]|uniref:protein-serine/threonine phosphatase n=1 Tax=Stephania japonica TaxID=461633 RepID=A0AAP0IXN6_9MAGN
MGNCSAKLRLCCFNAGARTPFDLAVVEPLDEGLGHSFCYVRPDPKYRLCYDKTNTATTTTTTTTTTPTTTFCSISGASVSANTSTHCSNDFNSQISIDRSSVFECSDSFVSVPLQPVPRCWANSAYSGPLIERGFLSGPLDHGFSLFEAEKVMQRSFSHGGLAMKLRSKGGNFVGDLKRAIAKKMNRGPRPIVAPIRGAIREPDWISYDNNLTVSSEGSLESEECFEGQNLQWAQGKAGEDRVQVVISEEDRWVFVGIYDGFNGPDAPDFLCSNLYTSVQEQLKGLLCEKDSNFANSANSTNTTDAKTTTYSAMHSKPEGESRDVELDQSRKTNHSWRIETNQEWLCGEEEWRNSKAKKAGRGRNSKAKKWEESQRRWKCEWERERLELDRKLKEHSGFSGSKGGGSVNHSDVLKALSQAMKNTEESFLEITEMMTRENPELAMMGSCVLVMLMKGEDVYIVNVGDSRAVLAHKPQLDLGLGQARHDLERINEETANDVAGDSEKLPGLTALQLTQDHSTSIQEEVQRIRNEHTDDASAITNDRVKGSLKVTRAFGAGFLKKPELNNALLEVFRINYIGASPYITCFPSLYHHRLNHRDRFLILSSDGLYQYFTNEEAVSEVEQFIAASPEGDPAQHLVEEVLFRAAKKAGMDFHDLLEIPQGDRRRYHDDISIIVISFEGRIWRSFAKIEKPTE